ncbi:MAG: adenylate cyclase [Flavobacteriaceae bacterium]|nr:adenylate cyclase [Flavobacteriaceae bacterium]|tara:strand:+ start:1206 stop:1679 length:474 start_codon:yes stop_codon:yes gene_type:complete
MALEIERKYLVTSDAFMAEAISETRIVQAFLNTDPERTVRVRIYGDRAFLTIKGKSNAEGTTRFEWEREIEVHEAEVLLQLCEPGEISKMRFEVQVGNHIFEIDQFYGKNKGLVVAEIELSKEDEAFEKPMWLGAEVTGDVRYYNSNLTKKPFISWK